MKIETKIDFNSYLNTIYGITYTKPKMIILHIFMLLWIFWGFLEFGHSFDFNEYFGVLFPIFILLYLPFSVYRVTKRNYYTNKNLQEKIIYEFNYDTIIVTGETFNSQFTWNSIYKVIEIGDMILIYKDRVIANFIKKIDFGNEFESFKQLVKQNNIKAKFKN